MSVEFTQYLRPNGRKQLIYIELDEETEDKAEQIIAKGLTFECEVLSDDITCSFTITDPEEGDLDIELCPNGPRVPDAVKRLIMRHKL